MRPLLLETSDPRFFTNFRKRLGRIEGKGQKPPHVLRSETGVEAQRETGRSRDFLAPETSSAYRHQSSGIGPMYRVRGLMS